MQQNNLKAPPEPPIDKDDNNVYNFKCEKGDSKYLNLKPNSIDRHMSRQQRKRRIIQGGFFDWSPQKSLSVEILYENT